MTTLCRLVIAPRQLTRALSLSVSSFKQIKHVETEKKIVVEGLMDDVNVKTTDLAVGSCGSSHQCHPFCKSPIVKDVKHTDVLILNQFVDSKGQMYSKEDLKICNVRYSNPVFPFINVIHVQRQWSRLHKLVQMSQRAGLMPGKEFYCSDYRKTKWGSQNCYWDEKTIDIQWNENKLKKKIKEFKTGIFKNY